MALPTRSAGTAAVRDATDLGAAIRAARRARGLTQAELAKRAGVGRQWLVTVERGHPRAEFGLLTAVLNELGLELATNGTTPVRRVGRPTVAETATAIREELIRGDEDFALRLVARCVADLRSLSDSAEIESFLAQPPSSGDQRWDTLLAASIGRQCRRQGITAPRWTHAPALPSWWFPVPDRLLVARTMQRTPIDLSARGIWLDAAALESA
jgi:y4mF family transcriptional regulator